MAKHFKGASACLTCFNYFETPYLKCECVCFKRTDSLQKDPQVEGRLCPHCSVVSEKRGIKHTFQWARLVSKSRNHSPSWEMLYRWIQDEEIPGCNHLIIYDKLRNVRVGLANRIRKNVPGDPPHWVSWAPHSSFLNQLLLLESRCGIKPRMAYRCLRRIH